MPSRLRLLGVVIGLTTALLIGCSTAAPSAGAITMRVGYFPNITHSQAAIGIADGTFQRTLGSQVKLDTKLFNADPQSAKQKLNSEIARITSQELPAAVLDDAWSRQVVTDDPVRSSLLGSADAAFRAGFLGETLPKLDEICDLTLLNQVLKENNLAPVDGEPRD